MNVANRLTMLRILLTCFLILFLLTSFFPFSKSVAIVLFAVAGLTDIYDGRTARKRGIVTDFGRLMDPIADKILISSVFIAFVQLDSTLVPAWMVIIIIAREFIITGLRLLAASKGEILEAGRWGKHKNLSQIVTVSLMLFYLVVIELSECLESFTAVRQQVESIFSLMVYVAMLVTVVLTVLSGSLYLWENRRQFMEVK